MMEEALSQRSAALPILITGFVFGMVCFHGAERGM